jgi:hypothetical protein
VNEEKKRKIGEKIKGKGWEKRREKEKMRRKKDKKKNIVKGNLDILQYQFNR